MKALLEFWVLLIGGCWVGLVDGWVNVLFWDWGSFRFAGWVKVLMKDLGLRGLRILGFLLMLE